MSPSDLLGFPVVGAEDFSVKPLDFKWLGDSLARTRLAWARGSSKNVAALLPSDGKALAYQRFRLGKLRRWDVVLFSGDFLKFAVAVHNFP